MLATTYGGKNGISWDFLNHHNKAYLPKQLVWHNSLWLGVVWHLLFVFFFFLYCSIFMFDLLKFHCSSLIFFPLYLVHVFN
jgi:hypothetical protein